MQEHEVRHRIRKIRSQLSLSQEKMGERLGIEQSVVSRLEGGTLNLSQEMAEKYASVSGKKASWILFGESDEQAKPVTNMEIYTEILKTITTKPNNNMLSETTKKALEKNDVPLTIQEQVSLKNDLILFQEALAKCSEENKSLKAQLKDAIDLLNSRLQS